MIAKFFSKSHNLSYISYNQKLGKVYFEANNKYHLNYLKVRVVVYKH